MNDADIAARLVRALTDAASPRAELASVNIILLHRAEIADIALNIERETRTLLFLSVEARDAAGVPVATASSVHKLRS